MKKHLQLGMNPSTAAHRLRMDILFKMVIDAGHKCFRCGESLDRESFSIEHKIPWLDSENPKKMFFSLENIAFSHRSCNYAAGKRPHKKFFSEEQKAIAHREDCKRWWNSMSDVEKQERRRRNYARYGA